MLSINEKRRTSGQLAEPSHPWYADAERADVAYESDESHCKTAGCQSPQTLMHPAGRRTGERPENDQANGERPGDCVADFGLCWAFHQSGVSTSGGNPYLVRVYRKIAPDYIVLRPQSL